jgi:hypothetical protein
MVASRPGAAVSDRRASIETQSTLHGCATIRFVILSEAKDLQFFLCEAPNC